MALGWGRSRATPTVRHAWRGEGWHCHPATHVTHRASAVRVGDAVSFRAKVWCALAIFAAVLYLWAEFLVDIGI